MPLKKKKKSRRTGAGSTKDDAAAVAAAIAAGIDPMTLVTGTQTETADNGKTKKKKLTKAEKAQAKLQKECDDFIKSGRPFQDFVQRMDKWLKDNYRKALDIFKTLDVDGEGYVTFDEFKAVLVDLSAPCTNLELHALCQLLDVDENEEINYSELHDGLRSVEERELSYTPEDIRPALMTSTQTYDHCPKCKMALWDGEPYRPEIPRYVEVLFRLVTFDSYRAHPGHFSHLVHSHTTGLELLQVIQDRTDIQSLHLSLFTDKSREPDAVIPTNLSLEEMGYKGGPRHAPEEILVYYDYKVEFTDCPILLCDHYFGQNVKI